MILNYKRTLKELREHAVLHWPQEILTAADEVSTLPLLLNTQDIFISILKVGSKNPYSWKTALENNRELNGSLFLKHLMVLADIGGEALNKLPPLSRFVPNGAMMFLWNGEPYTYKFSDISDYCTLTNSALNVDAKKLLKGLSLSGKGIDVCMLLLFGSQLIDDTLPPEIKDKCVLGEYLGKPIELDRFIKQRYLHVSKQISGAVSNSLGQFAQIYVGKRLRECLGSDWIVNLNASLPGVYHNDNGNGTNFDIVVVSPSNKHFGVEISFQVTTNSVIERKARESESVMRSVHANDHKICYVIDGAGNINVRESAVSILCSHSDCTVAMSDSEIMHLANYFMIVQYG